MYLWVHVENFGPQHYLNSEVKYVLMFANIKATKLGLRGCWITALIISALVLAITFGYNALELFERRHDGEDRNESEREWYFFISIFQIMCVIRFLPMTCSQSNA